MTINRTTLLDLPLPVTGTESGTWGNITNNGLSQYVDIAVAGMNALTSSNFTDGALTISNTLGTSAATNIAAGSAQYATIKVSSLIQHSTITAPASNRSYRIVNADVEYNLTIKASGQPGITFLSGQTGVVAFTGTDYEVVGVVNAASSTDNAVPRFNGTTGQIIQNSGVTIDNSNVMGGITQLNVDNLRLDGNAITSTNTDGNIDLTPNGTGEVNISKVDIDSGTIDGAVIGGASAAAGSFTTLNTSGAVVFNDAGADVDFRVEGDTDANLLFVDASAESIGVGTSSPNLTSFQRAVTLGDGTGSTVRHAYEINGGQSSAESSIGDFNVYNKGTLVSRMLTVRGSADNSGVLTFYTSNAGTSAERMRITSAGDVGIGTNAPINELTFGPTTSIISPDTTDGSDSKRLRFCGGGADAVSRGSYVTVYGNEYSGGQGELTLVAGDAVGGNIVFYTGSAVERMRIDTSGNVGIGTTSPNYTSVGSSSRVLAVSSPTAGDGVAFLNLNGTRTGGGVDSCAAVNFFNNGTANPLAAIFGVRNATDTAGILTFRTNDTERMRIDSDGNVGIGTTSPDRKLVVLDSVDNNLPAAVITKTGLTGANSGLQVHTNEASASGGSFGFRVTSGSTYDSPTNEIIRVNQHGLCFNGDTTAADALDDYEEGTWTPVLQGSTTAGTYVYDTDRTNGIYIKIGKMVTVFGVYRVFSVTSAGTGDGRITGLPFAGAVIDTSWNRSPGILRVQAGPTLANNGYFCATESSNYLVMALQGVATWAAIPVTDADFVDTIWFFQITYEAA
jgi:hypothetical protein